MLTTSETPILFVQTFQRDQLFPRPQPGGHESGKDFIGMSDDDQGIVVSDDAIAANASESETEGLETGYEDDRKEPAIHLAKKFTIEKDGKTFTAGIAGVQMSIDYMQKILMDSTTRTSNGQELSCKDTDEIRCYLIDLSGYILTSNQPQSKVGIGDFLGVSDPHLMRHLVREKNYFDERLEFNYQALCESEVDCTVASGNILTSTFTWSKHVMLMALKSVVSLVHQLNIAVIR